MDIFDLFIILLKNLKAENVTDVELAAKAHCSQAKINAMLNGTKEKPKASAKTAHEVVEKVEFRTLVKLFPEIFDEILRKYGAQGGGAGQAIVNSPGAATVNGNANSVHIAQDAALAAAELKILDDTDICDKCKVRVLRIIKGQ